ncbi:receptor-type tyrosine-protein phosphatase eta-like isoform X2 [Paramormyrops kingsleyae]|uniref:receptor-type tyrosine-protein phosphatase eta-like isoform X2 n=1 Tax=Paramormyrops kingsleyae TaxID=1676925 RepID=UPI000CD60665|nr:receptor-type tyrosine-protein phosphatase eta-like isoform X2 [Paramormyrops kingsleyae]
MSHVHLLQDFQHHCQLLAAKDNAGYCLEFERLSDVGSEFSTRVGYLAANREKNRYPHILPYDHCRVKLAQQNSHLDYINASYVSGGTSERDFICTQGPLRSTQADFWRMVWEQNVPVIVMVTDCLENDRVLCEQYWPQDCASQYGRVKVTPLFQRHCKNFTSTILQLSQAGCPTERKITHYYYRAWPDRGVPQDRAALCAFTLQVRQHLDSEPHTGPAVVHCSAGVGRSGTFVALLWLLQLCSRNIWPDVRGVVHNLRRHRMMMVQSLEQYIFIHTCLLHWMSEDVTRNGTRGQTSRRTHEDRETPQLCQGRRPDRQRSGPRDRGTVIHRLLPAPLLRRLQPGISAPWWR